MLSDDELLDRDTSDSIFANETPREDSPRTLTRHLINHFGISSKGGTETAINNTLSLMILQSVLLIHTPLSPLKKQHIHIYTHLNSIP